VAERQVNCLSTVALASFGLRRDPPRPLDDRQPGYLDLFDFGTLFYDVFRGTDPQEVMLVGPPLLNCAGLLDSLIFHLPGQNGVIRWDYVPGRSDYQPNFKIRLRHPALASAERLQIDADGQRIEVRVQPNGGSRFAGRRMILTLSKDNPLLWVRDWVEFNLRVHQADAVLVYDNGSSAYGIAELEDLLSGIPGIAALAVSWPFPYGPNVGRRNIQDSFFCQPGALDHARWRYCAPARGVLNNDIDELTVPQRGDSIFRFLERSGKAAIVYPGLWADTPPANPPKSGIFHHGDFLYSQRWRIIPGWLRPGRWLLRTKWVVQPALCPTDAEWGVHDIYPVSRETAQRESSWKLRTSRILYRHLRLMSAKPARQRTPRSAAIATIFDRPLARCLALAFAERPHKGALARAIERLAWISYLCRRR
jgi:hypothetical protein